MPACFVGVDVSKGWLDAAIHGERGVRQIANEAGSIRAWLSGLPAGSRVGMESTGRYHGLLASLAQAAGHVVYVLNAREVSCYAGALGRRAKTDQVDALLIARYLEREHERLHAWAPDDTGAFALSGLLQQRSLLVSQRVALRASFGAASMCDAVAEAYREALAGLEALIRRLETEITRLQRQIDEPQRLRSIPGVGRIGAAALSSLISRHPFRDANAVVAFAGLDPQARDSGQWQGRRRLSKRGPAHLRKLLYMVAMAAANTDTWHSHYQRWRERGLAPTQAYIALARKLIKTAFALLKHNCSFDPQRHLGDCQAT